MAGLYARRRRDVKAGELRGGTASARGPPREAAGSPTADPAGQAAGTVTLPPELLAGTRFTLTAHGIATSGAPVFARSSMQMVAASKGSQLAPPVLGLTLPVTVQLVIGDGNQATCWETVYTAVQKNDATHLKAKGP